MILRIGRGDRNAVDTKLVELVLLPELVMVLVLGIDRVLGDLRTVKHRGDVFNGSSGKFNLPSTTFISAVFLSSAASFLFTKSVNKTNKYKLNNYTV